MHKILSSIIFAILFSAQAFAQPLATGQPPGGGGGGGAMVLAGGNVMTGAPGDKAVDLNRMWLDTNGGLIIDSSAPYGPQMGSGLDMNGTVLNIHGGEIVDTTGGVTFGSDLNMNGLTISMNAVIGTHGGDLQMNGGAIHASGILYDFSNNPGSSGYIPSNNGDGTFSWTPLPGSSWVGDAQSNLNMNNYSIVDTNGGFVNIGSPINMNAQSLIMGGGSLYLSNTIDTTNSYGDPGWTLHTYGDGSGVYWGAGGGWTGTATSNLDMQGYTILDSDSGSVALGAPLNMNGNYITDNAAGRVDFGADLNLNGHSLGDTSGSIELINDLNMGGYYIVNGGTISTQGGFNVDGSGRISTDGGSQYWQLGGDAGGGTPVPTGSFQVMVNGTTKYLIYADSP